MFFYSKSANVASVTREAGAPVGRWCVMFSEPIPEERRIAAVVGVTYNGAYVANITLGETGCPGGIRVFGYAAGGSTPADAAFSFVVP